MILPHDIAHANSLYRFKREHDKLMEGKNLSCCLQSENIPAVSNSLGHRLPEAGNKE